MGELYELTDEQQKVRVLNLNQYLKTIKAVLLLMPVFCLAQGNEYIEKYNALNKLPKTEFEAAVNDSIQKLSPGDLLQFLYVLQVEYNTSLAPFCSNLTNRLATFNTSFDIYTLSAILLDEEQTEHAMVEKILTDKKPVWDKGEWPEKFWKLIRENGFKVPEGPFYTVNEKGEKRYDLESFLQNGLDTNEIGRNPLIQVDSTLVSYQENTLLETLGKLTIKDIEVTPKKESIGVYGKRGADGFLRILTVK